MSAFSFRTDPLSSQPRLMPNSYTRYKYAQYYSFIVNIPYRKLWIEEDHHHYYNRTPRRGTIITEQQQQHNSTQQQ